MKKMRSKKFFIFVNFLANETLKSSLRIFLVDFYVAMERKFVDQFAAMRADDGFNGCLVDAFHVRF
jgi:hypothetical protein